MKKITELVTSPEKPEHKAKRKAVTFGSFKRAEDRQVIERKQREHDAELAAIAETARIQRVVEEEHERVIKEQNTTKRNKYVTESLTNAFKPKTKDMAPVREQAISTFLPKEFLPVAKDYPEPFINKELADFKVKINEHLTKVGFASSGGGGIGSIADANDLADGIDDGEFLQYRASDGKFIGATATVSILALSKLDIDGGTDIGAAIVDADLLVIDDGANGTNRKTAASRIKTYVADVTLTTAAQTNITSVGTLTALQVDNLNLNGNTLSSTAGTDLLITPLSGQQIVLDGTIVVDAGVVTGATSITSTAFVGDITGDITGNADTATALATARTIGGTSFDGSANIAVGLAATATALATARTIGGTSFDGTGNIAVALATLATTVTITDNESTNENNAIIFTAGGDTDGGNLGLESDGTLTYNPSTGVITSTGIVVADDGTVGSASATDAITISSGGIVTLVDDLLLKDACTIGTATTAGAIAIAADGTVDLDVAGATVASAIIRTVGKESIWVPAAAMTPTTSNPCSDITIVETTSGRPDMVVLDFATGADEFAQFSIAFPKSWNLGTITYQAFWSGIAASTDCDWSLQGVAMNDNQTIDVAYGTAVVVSDNAQGAVEELYVAAESGAVTIAGTPADNDLCYFRIGRDVSGDNMDGDARLHGLKIFFTTDATNDA